MTARLTLGGDKLSDHGRGAAALLLEGDLGDDDVVLEDGAAAGADCVAASLVVLYVRSATLRADARHFLQLMHTNGKVPSQHLFVPATPSLSARARSSYFTTHNGDADKGSEMSSTK